MRHALKSNIDTQAEQHGGNLSWLAERYPDAPQPFIDLSTGINPYPYPLPEIPLEWHSRLNDAAEVEAAEAAAATYYQTDAENIALASGMQPLMFALSMLRMKEKGAARVAILSPTYAEHARVWAATGHTVTPVDDMDAAENDVVIIVNPNNPDGRTFAIPRLLKLAEQLAKRRGWLIVDESFVDLLPGNSLAAAAAKSNNLIVLRSCGKFFGLAGLRISMAIAPRALTRWLRTAMGPWPLSTAATLLLPKILADEQWIADTRTRLEKESATWRELLSQHFILIGHSALFTLAETENAADWQDHLAAHGILTRRFSYNPGWLRLGLPDSNHLPRIRAALAQRRP